MNEASALFNCFITAVGMFLLCLALHIPLTRIKGNSRFVARSLLWALLLALCYALFSLLKGAFTLATFIEIFLFLSLWNMFLIFMINLMNSFSLRMVGEIYESSQRKLSKTDLDRIFSDKESFESRLAAMISNAFISQNASSGDIQILPKGILYGRFFGFLRKFLGIKVFG